MNKVNFKNSVIFGLVVISVLLAKAVPSAELVISQSPLTVKDTAAPNVMLAMSRDHQLYTKAYTDYSDLDGDGMLEPSEITYNDSVDYYGYFDSNKCYTNAGGSTDVFVPRWSVDNLTADPHEHRCSSNAGDWSGNFLNWATMTRMDIIRKVLYGGYRSTDDATNGSNGGVTVLERTMIPYDAHAFVKVFSSTASDMLNYTPYSQAVISICNLTQGSGLSKNIDTTTYPPLMRVASGSWQGWAASQNSQCQWGSNNNTLPSTANNLVRPNNDDGLSVRVNVCISGQEETNCKGYTAANGVTITKKPTGLLQKYWESDKPIRFGLMTGSWGNNRSGGVLRAIAQEGDNDINLDDGTFKSTVNLSMGRIIATLDRFRISGYHFNNNSYGSDEDWGNPLSEIYLETLRYLAGKDSHTPAFASNNENGFLPPSNGSYQLDEKDWIIPINTNNWCAKCSIIAISAGANSFDTDELANDLTIDAANQTDTVGGSGLEDINGHGYFIGENGSDHNQRCTGKTLSSLSAALGICPEASSLEGGYSIAGLAYFARTHDFFTTESRNPIQLDEVYFEGTQSINTYSVDLSQNMPHFNVPLSSGTITFLPACEANSTASASSNSSGWTACAMIDLKVDSLNYDNKNNLVSGRFTVVWEDATAGSNFDMDGIERLEFRVASNSLEITTTVVQTAPDVIPKAMRFGYTIAGSGADGLKLPVLCNQNNSCSNTSDTSPPYDGSSAIVKFLESPLWYAAKYGGFDTIDPSVAINNQKPQNQSWDEDNNGEPDAFFKGTNPALLESALDEILNKVSSKLASSSSVAAANSTRLDTSAALFQAKFSPAEWTGQLLAYRINPADGSFASTPVWDAGQKVTDQGPLARYIYSYNDVNKTGIAFAHNQLSQTQQGLLTPDELDYIRGVQLEEQPNGLFRKRTGVNGLMGDIINSDPKFISSTSQGYDALPAAEGTDYLRYITSPAFVGRAPMLAVGANDGMFHVFNASLDTANGGGQELLAYVPSAILGKLKSLTLPTYITNGKHQYFVDGSPNAGDAYIDADGDDDKEWRTVLASTLGAGGKGIFALDLTFLSPNDYRSPEAYSDGRVMWEINDQTAPYPSDLTDDLTASPKRYGFTNYLGLTIGQASIVRVANGQFAAVFGNGYNSASQMAVLYIVDIQTGRLIRSINTGVGNNSSASTLNGLTTPLVVDANGDRITDAIYAGDYQGNMWKFDVSDNNPDNWKVAFTVGNQPAPLFRASSSSLDNPYYPYPRRTTPYDIPIPQPITAKPEFSQHPRGGIMLYFGTGKYFLIADNLLSYRDPINSFYGIWDDCVNYAGANASCSSDVPGSQTAEVVKSQLVQQTITYEDISNRVTSGNPVDYAQANPPKGWYMNLYKGSGPITGERVISQPIIRNQRIIFTSLYPDATGLCVSGGSSWLTLLDALSGKALEVSAFVEDSGTGGKTSKTINIFVNGVEVPSSISGVKSDSIIDTPAAIATNEETAILAGTGADGETFKAEISEPGGGRLSWLQLR